MTKKIALGVAALITLAPAAHADALILGPGNILCAELLTSQQDVIPMIWGWLEGKGPQTATWVGASSSPYTSAVMTHAIYDECQRNPHQTLLDAETSIYITTWAAGK